MSDPSSLIYNFSQNAHPGNLTQIGSGINQLVTQKRAAEAEAAKTANYNSILSQFMETKDASLLPELQNAYPEKFEGIQTAFTAMDDLQRKQTVQSNMEIIGALRSGNIELAQKKVDNIAEAYSNNGDYEDANEWKRMSTELKNGNADTLETYLSIISGSTPEGIEAMGNLTAMDENKRAQVASEAELFQVFQQNPWMTDQDKSDFATKTEGLGLETLTLLGRLAGVERYGGDISAADALASNQGIRKEYDAYVKPYITISHSVDQMERVLLDPSGAVDFAVIRLFNKALDPTSVVRESEAAGTAEAQSFLNELNTKLAGFKEGDLLSPALRADILKASTMLREGAHEKINEEKDRLMKTVDAYDFLHKEQIFMGDNAYDGSSNEMLSQRSAMVKLATEEGQPQWVIDKVSSANSIEELQNIGDGSLYTDANGGVAPSTARETPIVEDAETTSVKATLSEALRKRGADQAYIDKFNKLSLKEIKAQYKTLYEESYPTSPTVNIPDGFAGVEES